MIQMQNFIEHLTCDNLIGIHCYNIAPFNITTFRSVNTSLINYKIIKLLFIIYLLGT